MNKASVKKNKAGHIKKSTNKLYCNKSQLVVDGRFLVEARSESKCSGDPPDYLTSAAHTRPL